jgi:predicted ATP-dependent endonuclease of OLD family
MILQNLFVSKNNLLVEGPADLIYITILSNILEMENRTFLNENITVVPVGGLDKVSTFISLLRGSKLPHPATALGESLPLSNEVILFC